MGRGLLLIPCVSNITPTNDKFHIVLLLGKFSWLFMIPAPSSSHLSVLNVLKLMGNILLTLKGENSVHFSSFSLY
jgi:hypothetical protein